MNSIEDFQDHLCRLFSDAHDHVYIKLVYDNMIFFSLYELDEEEIKAIIDKAYEDLVFKKGPPPERNPWEYRTKLIEAFNLALDHCHHCWENNLRYRQLTGG